MSKRMRSKVRRQQRLGIGATLGLCASIALVLASPAVSGAIPAIPLVVNDVGDQVDANIADDVCDINLGTAGEQCTLRAAIAEANDETLANRISFNIPGSCPETIHTIQPATSLPGISAPVSIDGYSQPGATENTSTKKDNAVLCVVVDGSSLSSGNGLNLFSSAPGSIITGMVIGDFPSAGIAVQGADSSRVEGNFIGTDPAGAVAAGSGQGVSISSAESVTVGGTTPAARNVISDNTSAGVLMGSSVDAAVVQGNFIGTTASGGGDLGNGAGVRVLGNGNQIGGTGGAANKIAFSLNDGVEVSTVSGPDVAGNTIGANSIFKNGDLGIDLANDGTTPNDGLGDLDTGPNGLQNFPALSGAETVAGVTTIAGKLDSAPSEGYVIDFYSSPSGRQGKTFIGDKAVSTNASGRAKFTFTPANPIDPGQRITATATRGATGDTSEFSSLQTVITPP